MREGIDLIPAILLATFGNLVLVGAVGPWLARRMWKRRPAADPGAPAKAQLEVLSDRVGTGLLVAGVFGVLAAGLANRPTVVVETDQRERAAKLLEDYVEAHGDAELSRNLEASDTRRYADGYYRSCIPHDDRERSPASSSTRTSSSRSSTATQAPAARTGAQALDAGELRAAVPSGRTSSSSTRLRPRRSADSGTSSEKNSVRPPAQVEAAPDRADAAVDRHREVAHRAGRRARQPAGHAGGQDLRRRVDVRRAARRWRSRRGRRRRPASRHRPADQLRVGPDPVGRRPRVAEQQLALGARCRTCARATGAARSAAPLELVAAERDHAAEVAPRHRDMRRARASPREKTERPSCCHQTFVPSRSATVGHDVDDAHEAVVDHAPRSGRAP